jgi:hypothetical protein
MKHPFLLKFSLILPRMKLEDFHNVPIRVQNFSAVYPDCRDLLGKVKRLERAGEIIRLKRGMYVLSPQVSREVLSPFLIANHIYGPSYVSMESALRYYGLIPETVYENISVTLGVARSYTNKLGTFRYVHSSMPYYPLGVTMQAEEGVMFQIASPEKALCDKIVFTPQLNLRYQEEVRCYLEEDLRLDMDAFFQMDLNLLRQCAEVSRKKPMINQLIKLIKDEQDV